MGDSLDEILEDFYDGDIRQSDMGKAKQAIKQLIATELNDRLNAHYAPELKTYDYDGIAESMIEWLGELKETV